MNVLFLPNRISNWTLEKVNGQCLLILTDKDNDEMKKTILFLLTFVSTLVSLHAQELTATLQQGDKMTAFLGANAFKDAYDAAQDGAIITLSSGTFNTVDSITKQVSIIGNGFYPDSKRTYIKYPNYKTYRPSWTAPAAASLIINADNVKIEGVYCDLIVLRNISNLHINRCRFTYFESTHTHTNTIVESSYVVHDYSLKESINMCYRNSIIMWFEKHNTTNLVVFSNCVLPHYYDYYCADSDNVIKNYDSPYGQYNNCILGVRHYSYTDVDKTTYVNYWQGFCSNSQTKYYQNFEPYHNNAFFLYPYKYEKNSSGNWSETLCSDMLTMDVYDPPTNNYSALVKDLFISNNFTPGSYYYSDFWKCVKKDISITGSDGTMVGIYGGSGFSTYSSIPHIVESSIASDTDSNGKLSVKLKVSVNQ